MRAGFICANYQADGTARSCFTTMGLETLKNENQEADEDMLRLRNASGVLHAGTTPLYN